MKNRLNALVPIGAILITVTLMTSGCGSLLGRSDSKAEFGGYVVDVTTGQKLTDYEMIIETPDSDSSASVDSDTGKFSFTSPRTSDYQVIVKAAGYREFVSTNRAPYLAEEQAANTDAEIVPSLAYYFSVPMISEKLQTPEVALRFADAADGKVVNGGAFRLTATGVAGGFDKGVYGEGTTIAGMQWWMPDASSVSGEITNGEVKIPANKLLPGFSYKLSTFGVVGYKDAVAETITVSSTGTNLTRGFQVKLSRNEVPAPPVLVAQSNLDAVGTPIPSGRSIRFLFEKQVDFNLDALKGMSLNQILSVNSADNDRDGITTSAKIRAEALGRNDRSAFVKVETDNHSLTLTFSEDTQLIDGTIDMEDDLSYAISAAFLGAIKVKDHLAVGPGSWNALSGLGPKALFVVRSNNP